MKRFLNFRLYVAVSFLLLLVCVTGVLFSAEPFYREIRPSFVIGEDKMTVNDEVILYKALQAATDSKGNIYVLERGDYRIVKFNDKGDFIKAWGGKGRAPGEFNFNSSTCPLFIDKQDNIYVGDRGNRRIQIFNTEGRYAGGFGINHELNALSVDSRGEIYISVTPFQASDNLVMVYDKNGKLLREFAKAIDRRDEMCPFSFRSNVSYLTHDKEDNLYLVFQRIPYIRKYDLKGRMIFERKIDLSHEILEGFSKHVGEFPLQTSTIGFHDATYYFCWGAIFGNNHIFIQTSSRKYVLVLGIDGRTTGILSMQEHILEKCGVFWAIGFDHIRGRLLFVRGCILAFNV